MNTIDAADYTWRDEAGGEKAARKCLDFLSQIGIETAPTGCVRHLRRKQRAGTAAGPGCSAER